MFRASHRSSSGALNCICSLWFTYIRGDRPLSRLRGKWIRYLDCYYWSINVNDKRSWWWAVCRSKHVEPSLNVGIIILLQDCILLVIST